MSTWFPLEWWIHEDVLVVKAETDQGRRMTLKLDKTWSRHLDMRHWYKGDGISSIIRCKRDTRAARILYISSSFDWLGIPTQITVYDGEGVHHLDVSGLVSLWKMFKPHLIICDRHKDMMAIIKHASLMWALGRIDDFIPYKESNVPHYHHLGIDGQGMIYLDMLPLGLVPAECMYMPMDQWVWLDQHHRSILLHMVDIIGPLPTDTDVPLTWRIPSWHRQKDGCVIFDMNMYAGQGEVVNLLASYTSPSGSFLFSRPPDTLYPYMHQIDGPITDSPIIQRCKQLSNKYRGWIGKRHELLYCHLLNGTHHKVFIVERMPLSRGDVSVLGIIQQKRLHRLLDLMSGSKIKNRAYRVHVDSMKIISFCEAFNRKPTMENMMTLLYEEYLICGAKYKEGILTIPLNNIVAHVT